MTQCGIQTKLHFIQSRAARKTITYRESVVNAARQTLPTLRKQAAGAPPLKLETNVVPRTAAHANLIIPFTAGIALGGSRSTKNSKARARKGIPNL